MLCVVFAVTISHLEAQVPPASLCVNQAAGVIFPDYSDCSRFFRCPGGNGPVARGNCDPGRYFDPPTGQCLPQAEAHCYRCPANQAFVEERVPRFCNQFIRCIDNRAQHLDCANGLLFDQRLGTCNLEQSTTCLDIRCPPVDNPNNRLWARDPNNCGVYDCLIFYFIVLVITVLSFVNSGFSCVIEDPPSDVNVREICNLIWQHGFVIYGKM